MNDSSLNDDENQQGANNMNDTKERILLTSLRLFAKNGYDAVSVSHIATELGMVKSALYKHYKSKKDIFDHILARMEAGDAEKANENHVPEGTLEETPAEYANTKLDDIRKFTKEMFHYWTIEEYPSLFRKMLTIEQYKSEEMADLYKQYLSSGPLSYVEDLFAEITNDRESAKVNALKFYAPMFMLYSLYDTEDNKDAVNKMLENHVDQFINTLKKTYGLE